MARLFFKEFWFTGSLGVYTLLLSANQFHINDSTSIPGIRDILHCNKTSKTTEKLYKYIIEGICRFKWFNQPCRAKINIEIVFIKELSHSRMCFNFKPQECRCFTSYWICDICANQAICFWSIIHLRLAHGNCIRNFLRDLITHPLQLSRRFNNYRCKLIHWGQVTHVSVSKLGHHWFR